MLFPYKYVQHDFEKMQSYVNHIFFEVWCQAPAKEYGIELFDGCPELKSIIENFWKNEELAGKPIESAKFFLVGINDIFNEFKILSNNDIQQLKGWFIANNDIEGCCRNSPTVTPVQYADIKVMFPGVETKLNSFFTQLYSHNFLSLKIFKNYFETISDHYNKFVRINDEDICPFCGLMPLDSQWSETRDAYDHFLPKSKYPFNSINLKNLLPCCNACNSKNKGVKDPLNSKGYRRKAFYPFANTPHRLTLEVSISATDWCHYLPKEISIAIGPEKYCEEISVWVDVYNIEARYKDFMCRKNFGKAWISQVVNWRSRGHDIDDFFNDLDENEQNAPYCDYNFLKKAFLKGCQNAGLFTD
jgi:hypothetical protein